MTTLPTARGAVSAHVLRMLHGAEPGPLPEVAGEVLADEDVQLALWCLFELHHRGFDDVDPDLEWDPEVIRVRRVLESAHLAALRDLTSERLEQVMASSTRSARCSLSTTVRPSPSTCVVTRTSISSVTSCVSAASIT